MRTITFTYEKRDGSKSERTLIAMVEPSDKYAGIDISQLPPSKAAEFAACLNTLHDEYLTEVQELQASFDLKYSYRLFFADGMTDITVI